MGNSDTSSPAQRPSLGILGNGGLFLIGIAALILALEPARLFPGSVDLPSEPIEDEPQEPTGQPDSDYRLVQLGEYRRDQFLLDQSTGRIWVRVCSGELTDEGRRCDGMMIWDESYIRNITPLDSPAGDAYLQQVIKNQNLE